MTTIRLTHCGKGHRSLRFLANAGPSERFDLADALGLQGHHRRKLGVLLGILRDRGLVCSERRGLYAITDEGLRVLAVMDATGADFEVHDPGQPSVRVFAREAA